MDLDDVVKKIKDALIKAEIAPWKTKDEAEKEGIPDPKASSPQWPEKH